MATSTSERAYVWTWLPGTTEPVPAGLLVRQGSLLTFQYGTRYLERAEAIALGPDLPLRAGRIEPEAPLEVAGSLRDASPDAWGRQVVDYRRAGILARDAEVGVAPELVYMLESDSNRFGAMDFQESSEEYVHRGEPATVDQLLSGVDLMARGEHVPEAIARALGHGTTMGGARPKATVTEGGTEYIAKFSRQSDTYDLVGAEAAAMFLAGKCGVDVAQTRVLPVSGKKVLFVERFDRTAEGQRKHIVSALTLSGLNEKTARYGTYPALVARLRREGTSPERYGEEIFRRIAVNIAVSNNDDHLRNHAAFWDGHQLDLTPAYDICPQPRSGETSTQALGITDDHAARASTFGTLFGARHFYGVAQAAARDIIDYVIHAVEDSWGEAVEHAELSTAEAHTLRAMHILNRGTLHDYEPARRAT